MVRRGSRSARRSPQHRRSRPPDAQHERRRRSRRVPDASRVRAIKLTQASIALNERINRLALMAGLTIPQRLGRLLIVGLVCSVATWGVQFLPSAYQPSRPLYALAWLVLAAGSYLLLRRRYPYLSSVAGVLSIIFGAV